MTTESSRITESAVEQAALTWFGELGYKILRGHDIAPGELFAGREECEEPFLPRRPGDALARLRLRAGVLPQDSVRKGEIHHVCRSEVSMKNQAGCSERAHDGF